ncbi:hypothetical protein RIF29_29697 [Crotalaria pallida]|uniref:Uncharacterized protein n=1 Tax=Crotalaria pallida TaxID=3830 RepID=A0AAN9EFF4_CROPI
MEHSVITKLVVSNFQFARCFSNLLLISPLLSRREQRLGFASAIDLQRPEPSQRKLAEAIHSQIKLARRRTRRTRCCRRRDAPSTSQIRIFIFLQAFNYYSSTLQGVAHSSSI